MLATGEKGLCGEHIGNNKVAIGYKKIRQAGVVEMSVLSRRRRAPGVGNTVWAVRASFKIRRLRRLSRGSADPREL